jgi:hypothetical protein
MKNRRSFLQALNDERYSDEELEKDIRLFLIGLAVALVDLGIFLGQAVMR